VSARSPPLGRLGHKRSTVPDASPSMPNCTLARGLHAC
jgi:hypothetical protein